MPEFKRKWKDWAEEKFPEPARYWPAKTDKSPSVSFGRSIADQAAANFPETDSGGAKGSPDGCTVPACNLAGHLVDLGAGFTIRLCAPHRRELFRSARTLSEGEGGVAAALFDKQPCRFCGEPVAPEDEPCKQCVAARSPLIQGALRLGGVLVCPCGEAVLHAGDLCALCLSRPTEGEG